MNHPAHLDIAVQNLAQFLVSLDSIEKALIIEDSLGRISLAYWGEKQDEESLQSLAAGQAGDFFSGSVFWAGDESLRPLLDLQIAWNEAKPLAERVRRLVRFRNLSTWQMCEEKPLWPLETEDGMPNSALVSFFSHKGGLGRTTMLISFALQRVAMGERVVVVDLDFEAPGLDLLSRYCEPASQYGVVDYLLEASVLGKTPELSDYYATVAEPRLVDPLPDVNSTGALTVFVAGKQDAQYLSKVSRLDLEWELARSAGLQHPLEKLLHQIKDELAPDWILLDSRTGFSEIAGLLLSGISHFHVLVGVQSEQSWAGLERVIGRLGEDRLHQGLPQCEAMLVQAMTTSQAHKDLFALRAEKVFTDHYYQSVEMDSCDIDEALTIADAESDDSPHRVIAVPYYPSLAQEVSLDDSVVLELLKTGAYKKPMADRIATCCGRD